MQAGLLTTPRKLALIAVITITSTLASTLAILALAALQFMVRSPEEAIHLTKVMSWLNDFMYLTFVVPTALGAVWLLPLYWQSGPWKAHRRERLVLRLPFAVSLISTSGWAMAYVLFFAQWASFNFIGGWSTGLKFFVECGLMALISFVTSFYLLEFVQRRYLIPLFFPDQILSRSGAADGLSLGGRFAIHFVSVTVFPLAIFMSALVNLAKLDIKTTEALGLVVLALGLLSVCFTWFLLNYFNKPLSTLRRAVTELREGNYAVNVPVRSNDALGLLAEGLNELGGSLAEKERINETFGRAVDPAVRDWLLANHEGLGGETRVVTVLYSDIRSFTRLSESMSPARVVQWLNLYFSAMTACVEKHGGVVNKFIGDALLAVFNAPQDLSDHALAAIKAARAMKAQRQKLNEKLRELGLPEIQAGIAVHTGPVLAGALGSTKRLEFTIIGDTVNLTARFEKLTKTLKHDIVASQASLEACTSEVLDPPAQSLGTIKARGSSQSIRLWGL